MCPLPFAVENYTIAKFTVPHALTEFYAQAIAGHDAASMAARTRADGTTDLYPWPDLLNQFLGNLGDKARGL